MNMSRIDDLIAEYCPDGVKHQTLGEIGEFIRGNGIQKRDFQDSGFGCIHYGQIYTYYGLFADHTKSFIDPNLAEKRKKAYKGDLVIATTSENEEDVCKACAWLGEEPIAISGDAYIFRHHQNPKYISYCFQSELFQSQKKKYITGTKVLRVNGDAMAKIHVPVPPLPVQEEIVRILDSFSSLEAELEAELEARRKQYTHYRDELLKFERVLIASLGELCKISVGRKNGTAGEFGEYPYVNAGTSMSGFVNEWSEEGDCVTTPSRGQGGMGFVAYQASRFWCGPLCYVMRSKHSDVMIKYVYYYLCSHKADILGLVHEGGTPAINKSELAGLRILVPPFEEQQRIVSILDRFDKLTNDLSSGLPAEIEARHKQYEYYRDRLLSFDELAA
ncbi:restriction endonuclease subunit S [Bifidobacterium longum subsp. longum]|jgi:type I restriction enzyme S subunit|uniref:Restriction endonuclease subunit S n=2 Tax=Bifidobacterium longum subsp. longum TaxID=1679 RepID=A0A0A6Y603_BIFLL|nr:restriction endonuclease subunit S [Bifidobacterium longum subsp. longum]UNL64619.1 restriction endonuclease subunit S [Bifidobacterium longum subsp. longum]UNL67097.1 restriction endonuclease subunit S [Bifidobacterium longum subsp. longum]UNL69527.1 restriction endonuclease subunit S [Bifidobacterium longum subsp. longum]UNL71549.1 restriction endonuclease subunit S [Bifidobacterium longum subsp. longum]